MKLTIWNTVDSMKQGWQYEIRLTVYETRLTVRNKVDSLRLDWQYEIRLAV